MFKKGFTLIELLIVVAIIAILAAIAVPNFLEAQVRSKVSRVKADIRSLATAIESYYVDNNSYPAVDSSNEVSRQAQGLGSGWGVNDTGNVPNASLALRNMPTFRGRGDGFLNTLTTPISYISSYFSDPFMTSRGGLYLFSTVANHPDLWFAWSFGPDTDEKTGGDVTLINIAAENTRIEETFYSPINKNSELLRNATYDPTNGSTSNGDVWRIKQ